MNENTDWWIDLFGWGTADNPTLSTSSDSQYATYKEWGNKVSNSQTTWRTLKGREWWYILTERENAKNLYGVATVNENKGLIILPDNWVLPIGLTFKPGVSESSFEAYARNVYTIDQWEKMEAAGAVIIGQVIMIITLLIINQKLIMLRYIGKIVKAKIILKIAIMVHRLG